jgi:hypothetical protein
LPVSYPLLSGYLELADVKTVCALQLVAQLQSGLAGLPSELLQSEMRLEDFGVYAYFKYATMRSG